jgi:phospholipase/carboxylesterase
MTEALIVQRPPGAPQQLILLFHGVGGTPRDLLPLARRLAAEFPTAFVVSVAAPHPGDRGHGRQWFSAQDIGDENRAERIRAAMPAFIATVRHWQQTAGASVAATALVGFSQGAIMALESTRHGEVLAGRIAAIAGRYARLPERATPETTLHLFHGKTDAVIGYAHTLAAAERLVALGGDVTADVLPFVGHEINATIEDLLIERLRGYIPRRLWEEALRAEPEAPAAICVRPPDGRLH